MKKFIILKHFVKNKIYFVPSWIALSELHCLDCTHWIALTGLHCLNYTQWIALSELPSLDCTVSVALTGLHCLDCTHWIALSELHPMDCTVWISLTGLHCLDCTHWIARYELHCVNSMYTSSGRPESTLIILHFTSTLYNATCELHHARIKPCTVLYLILFIPHPYKCILSFYSAFLFTV